MKELFEKLTNAMSEAIQSGISLALHSKNQEVQALHVIWGQVTNTSSLLNQALNKMNIDKSALELELKSAVERYPKVSTVTKENIKISRDLAQTLQKAEGEMTQSGDQYLSVDTWISANLEHPEIKTTLSKYIDLLELKKTLEAIRGGRKIDSQSAEEKLEALEKYGIDLNQKALNNELDRVIGRDEEIQRMMQILIRKSKNNPILLGEPGVGKTALAEGLAQKIAEKNVPTSLQNKRRSGHVHRRRIQRY